MNRISSVRILRASPRVAALLVLAAAGTAQAQDVLYQPIDPSLGGNAFNSAHLIGVANAQNTYKDPNAASSGTTAEIFARQLQSRLLSALSSQIVNAIFGDNPQQSGTISFGDQSITFDRGLENITLNITDTTSGEVTTIVVPIFLQVN